MLLDLTGKKILVTGIANNRSIAWGIAQQLAAQGAELAFSYQDEALERRVRPLVESLPGNPTMVQADVTDDASMDACFSSIKDQWGTMDFLVHAIAFAGKDELVGSFTENTTREGWRRAMDISAFSFVDAGKRASHLMPNGGSMVTLTYLGSERVVPSYNAHASFIASPIFDGGELIGVLAFQMPVARIDDIMTNHRGWTEVGLGSSGETYIVGDEDILRDLSAEGQYTET